MEMQTLKIFVAAVEEESLSRAALREDLVVSAVSKRIADLERSLGVSLLRRHGRGVSPTEAGLMLYRRAKSIFKNLELARRDLMFYAATGRPKIRLAANRSTAVQFLPYDLGSFLKRNEDCLVDLVEEQSMFVPRRVLEGEADLGIYHSIRPAPGVYSRVYRKDRVCLIAPRSHPLADRGQLYVEEALDYEFLGYFPRHSLDGFLDLAGVSLSQPLRVKSEIVNYEARCRMVAEGLGLAIVPERIARNYLSMMSFQILALQDAWAIRTMYLCVRDPDAMPEKIGKLFDHLLACCPGRGALSPLDQQAAVNRQQNASDVARFV